MKILEYNICIIIITTTVSLFNVSIILVNVFSPFKEMQMLRNQCFSEFLANDWQGKSKQIMGKPARVGRLS